MVRVLLINPPQKYFEQSLGFNVYFPIGLLYIGAMIKDICEVKILDCLITDFKIKKTKNFILYGTPFEKIRTIIRNFNPDIVGVTVPFSAQSSNSEEIGRLCKQIDPNITVVFGGPDPSVRYQHFLKNDSCDFCVVGEGEKTFFEFVKNFHSKSSLKNIGGLACNTTEGIQYRPREFLEILDEIPLPAYELINFKDYLGNPYLYISRSGINPKKSISVITSRGCPYDCVFCSIKLHMGKKYRYHSPNYVIKHLKLLIERYGISTFHFEDDNISLNKSRFEQILDKIIENDLKIHWDIPNGIRTDTLDFDLLKKIKKSGCKHLTIAIESGNQHVLSAIIKKNTSLDYMIKVIEYCKQLRIRLSSFYVIGFPGETIENIKETLDLSLKLYKSYNVSPNTLVATPLYGTELYDTCVKEKIIDSDLTDEDLSIATQSYGNPLITTKEFSKDDIKNLMREYELKFEKERNSKLKKDRSRALAEAMINYIKSTLRGEIDFLRIARKLYKLGLKRTFINMLRVFVKIL